MPYGQDAKVGLGFQNLTYVDDTACHWRNIRFPEAVLLIHAVTF